MSTARQAQSIVRNIVGFGSIGGIIYAFVHGAPREFICETCYANESKFVTRMKERGRPNHLQADVVGFTFADSPGIEWGKYHKQPYWNELASYKLSKQGAENIMNASNELHDMFLIAIEHVLKHDDVLEKMGVQKDSWEHLRQSWENKESDILGRFNLIWNGSDYPKLLDYNGETPTLLLESSIAQWRWQLEVKPTNFQCNAIDANLQKAWPKTDKLTFSCVLSQSGTEDYETVKYLQYTATTQGLETEFVPITQLTNVGNITCVKNDVNHPVKCIWKFYPYEWLCSEQQAGRILQNEGCTWLEPHWKNLASNKGMLCVLWELFPNHPLLLPAYFELKEEHKKQKWVSKPCYGREAESITYSDKGRGGIQKFMEKSEKIIKENEKINQIPLGPPIYQEYMKVPRWSGRYVITSTWMVKGKCCGICFREDVKRTINTKSCFVPHFVVDEGGDIENDYERTVRPPYDLRHPLYLTKNKIKTELNNENGNEKIKQINKPTSSWTTGLYNSIQYLNPWS